MRFVSVTSSIRVSKSTTPETAGNAVDIMHEVKNYLDSPTEPYPTDIFVDLSDGEYNKEPELPIDIDDDWDDGEW